MTALTAADGSGTSRPTCVGPGGRALCCRGGHALLVAQRIAGVDKGCPAVWQTCAVSVLLIGHALAGTRTEWTGEDVSRPLSG
jgi:hypothetical protein